MTWNRSSHCTATSCVEVDMTDSTMIHVHDGKAPDGPVLSFTNAEWRAFIAGAKAGEFDVSDDDSPADLLKLTRHSYGEYTINGWRVRLISPGVWHIIDAMDGRVMYRANTLAEVKTEIRTWAHRALEEVPTEQ